MTTVAQGKDYEGFLAEWGPRMHTAIRQFGFSGADEEDIFQDLICEFFENDYLNIYDPTKGAMSTFVYAFVNVRMLAYNRTRRNQSARTVDLEVLDLRGIGSELYTDEETLEIIKTVAARLAALPVRGKRDLCRLFLDLATQVLAGAGKNQSFLAERYGVSPAALTMQMKDLRQVLQDNELVVLMRNDVMWA